MALEDIPLEAETNGGYWSPEVDGEYIEGNVCGFEEGYNEGSIVMVIQKADESQVVMPDHKTLTRYTKYVELGDFVRVTYKGEKPNKNPEYSPTKIYKVQKDPERKLEVEE